jgi:hypothetical protein
VLVLLGLLVTNVWLAMRMARFAAYASMESDEQATSFFLPLAS